MPINPKETKSIMPARLANLSPRYPATIVVAPLVPRPTPAITPYSVADKANLGSTFNMASNKGSAELKTCLTACPSITVTASLFLPLLTSGPISADSIDISLLNVPVKPGNHNIPQLQLRINVGQK